MWSRTATRSLSRLGPRLRHRKENKPLSPPGLTAARGFFIFMYGKTKEETYQINKAFMLNPDQWPFTGSVTDRIYLKRYNLEEHLHDLGQLVYTGSQWGFCQDIWDDRFPDARLNHVRTGGPELIEAILQEGWVVD
jgi:hypothetical protein